ncbi:MAG: hypothetical protein AAGJ37_06290, partial [Pseudomonadota bacterium]
EKTIEERSNELPSTPKQNVEPIDKQAKSEEAFLTESLTTTIQEIASMYEAQSRYPHYSTPVVDKELAKSQAPFQEARVTSPTFDQFGELLPLTLSASTDKLDYAIGEPVIIQVVLDGAENLSSIFSSAEIKPVDSNQNAHKRLKLLPFDNRQDELRASFNSNLLKIEKGAQEFLAVITVEVDGHQHLTTVPFTVNEVSAELLAIKDSKQANDFLEISLDFEVHDEGYYFVHGYLDDANSLEPLLVLQTEGKMRSGRDQLILRAHHQALKDAGSQGPYLLRVVNAFRGAAPGESNDVIVKLSEESYSIPDFAFDGYDNTPYEDPNTKRRIDALKSLVSN